MENSWMNKCSSSSWSSVPSSSQNQQQQGVNNQMKFSVGSFDHPYGMEGVSSHGNGVVGEPMVFNSLNSGSCKLNKPELGNSFLSLLSGRSSQAQHQIQPIPSSTKNTDVSSLLVQNSSRLFAGDSNGSSIAPVGVMSLQSGNCNRKLGSEYCLIEPSRATSTFDRSYFPDLHGIRQMGNVTFNSELNRVGGRSTVICNEMGTDLLYARQGWISNFHSANDQNNIRSIHTSQMPSVTVSAASGLTPTSRKGSLRVFCLATNGELLLNNKGLLGVVCLCHGQQMSVSKFCEHSGSCIVNPGDAVRLVSGETVSQWCKRCFPEYGIRIPDDKYGWDWPDKSPAAAALVNCKPTAPNISTNSDMFKVDPFTMSSSKSTERRNIVVSPNNSRMGDCVPRNTFVDVMHDVRQNNAQEGCMFSPKSLDGTARVLLPSPVNTQAVHTVNGTARSCGSEKARERSGFQSIADYIGFLPKGSDLLTANQGLGNFKYLGASSDVYRCQGSKEASTAEREGASSNIELRLGQPSQQSYNPEGSIITALHPQPYVAHNDNHKSLLQDHKFHNAVIGEVTEKSRQHFWHNESNTSNSPRRKESKMSFRQLACMDPAKVDQCKGDMAKSSHMFFSHSSAVSERDTMHRERNNIINYSEAFMSTGVRGEYHGTNGSSNIPRNKSYGMQTQLDNNKLCHVNHIDKGKSVHHIADNYLYTTEKGNHMASSSRFLGVFSDNNLPSGGTIMNGSQAWCRSRGALEDKFSVNNQSNQHGNASCLQGSNCFEQVPPGLLITSTLSSGPNLSLPKVSTGLLSTNSSCRPSLMQLLSNKESDITPHILDENLGLLALRHTFDLSKQNHEIITHKMEQAQERLDESFTVQMQQRASTLGSEVSAELKEGQICTLTKSTPVFAPKPLKSRPNDRVNEHLPGATGAKSWCNFSTSSHGTSFHSKEHDIGHPPFLSSLEDKQALPCQGSTQNNDMTSEPGVGSQREPNTIFTGNSSCAVHSDSVARNCVSRGEVPSGPYKEQVRIIGNTSKPVPSKVEDNHMVQEAKTTNQYENVDRQIHLRNGCHASQWKDVPSKRSIVCNDSHLKKSTEVFGVSNAEAQSVLNAGKRFEGRTKVAESLNEEQISTAYSACSAPAITEITFEANTTDSCTVDTENERYVNEDVVDEASGIERCWSSDDAFESERSSKSIESYKSNSEKGGSPSSQDRVDTLGLQSTFGLKKLHQLPGGHSVHGGINKKQQPESNLKTGKRKKIVKWKKLDDSFPASGLSSVQHESTKSSEDTDSHSCSSRGTETLLKPSAKRKHSSLMSAKILSQKRSHCELSDDYREGQGVSQKQMKADMNPQKLSKSSTEKKLKQYCAPDMRKQCSGQEFKQNAAGKAAKYCSATCSKKFHTNQIDTCGKKRKPVVCGKYGVISNGELGGDHQKPAKIIPLSTILKTSRRCSTPKIEEPVTISNIDTRKTCCKTSGDSSEDCGDVIKNKVEVGNCTFNTKKSCLEEDTLYVELLMSGKEKNGTSGRMCKYGTICSGAPLKSRFKEARKRSLSELAGKGKELHSSLLPIKAREYSPRSTFKSHGKSNLKKIDDVHNCHRDELFQGASKKEKKGQSFVLDSDAFCSVCGTSRKDADNCLLECNSCLIRVHQACYGVSKVPKDRWCCRPCRANSKDNVCVLCGYEGGAMTQALKSRNIVKGLLEAWSIASESKSKKFSPLSETSKEELRLSGTSGSGYEVDSNNITRTTAEQCATALLIEESADKMDGVKFPTDIPSTIVTRTGKERSPVVAALLISNSPETDSLQTSADIPSDLHLHAHNSVTAGILDSSVKQWVHMVCGLWTPGTRCPNVHTMSAFDVSGVLCPPKNVVCSMCNRAGGSYIKCRVMNCSVYFHPWCAHQKDLLQSEVEGVDNDMVGFYGTCMLHATHHGTDSINHPIENFDTLTKEEFTCARTEGYKGRQKDGFSHKVHDGANVNGECLVPQEQVDAWLHINAHKPFTRGLLKTQPSDVECDSRKEYARYKQAKGWKNLVVYKSGIHGLGLYTSQFISRGAMVVEYVGEIVGLRVADKREVEYQSGRKLQYKSACYFFRIDKECIIDATQKGGIARFVNHSCVPNCVAKIISVRSEKKVVFFAERDIYPGEEVTYDYHFNHEDEGEKIPCLCNSRKCRRYLN